MNQGSFKTREIAQVLKMVRNLLAGRPHTLQISQFDHQFVAHL